MIRSHGFFRADLAFHDPPEHLDEGQLVFGVVDLAAEEGHAGAVLLGVSNHLERVVSRAGRAAEDADDQVGVVAGQFLGPLGAVVDHLEEQRAAGLGHPAQAAHDHVVDVGAQLVGGNGVTRRVRVEDLEEVPEALLLGLDAEGPILIEGAGVAVDVVVEGHAVQAEVGPGDALRAVHAAALDLLDGRGAEGLRRLLEVGALADHVHIGGVVGPGRGGHVGVVEQPLADGQQVVGMGGHEHDVDQALADHLADALVELGQAAELALLRVVLRRLARRGDTEGHVRILGIRDDELATARRVGPDLGQLDVQRLGDHEKLQAKGRCGK